MKQRRRRRYVNPKDSAELLFAPIEGLAKLLDKAITAIWKRMKRK